MNRLNLAKRVQVIHHLVEGYSLASASRLTGVAPNTVMDLLVDVGSMCNFYLWKHMVKVPCERIQADEIWAFVGMKEKRVSKEFKRQLGYGDVYTWVAFCPDTKLVPSYHVGRRDGEHAKIFMDDLSWRLSNWIQLTTDGFLPYLEAVEGAFGGKIDYAMVKKVYGGVRVYRDGTTKKCGLSECSSIIKEVITGKPDPAHISTSLVERQNATMRDEMRRFTRDTFAFSKKFQNHRAAVGLHFMHYNFARIHQTLRCTPAMEAGLAKSVWSIEEIVQLAA